jgi:hypothetical protein
MTATRTVAACANLLAIAWASSSDKSSSVVRDRGAILCCSRAAPPRGSAGAAKELV